MNKFIPVNIPKIFKNEKRFVNHALRTNWISSEGPFVKKFEKNFSIYNKKKFGVAVSNGTAALEIAIKSLNLKQESNDRINLFATITRENGKTKDTVILLAEAATSAPYPFIVPRKITFVHCHNNFYAANDIVQIKRHVFLNVRTIV